MSAKNRIEELKEILASNVEQYTEPAPGYEAKKIIAKELSKSPTAKKIAGELSSALVNKIPKDASIKDKEWALQDVMNMVAYEISMMAMLSMVGKSEEHSVEEAFEDFGLTKENIEDLEFEPEIEEQEEPFPGKLGTGERFKACVKEVMGKKGFTPKVPGQSKEEAAEAICAAIGRKVHGKEKLTSSPA